MTHTTTTRKIEKHANNLRNQADAATDPVIKSQLKLRVEIAEKKVLLALAADSIRSQVDKFLGDLDGDMDKQLYTSDDPCRTWNGDIPTLLAEIGSLQVALSHLGYEAPEED